MGNRRIAFVMVAVLAFGWIVGPRIASAVGSLVTIQNNSGTQKAGVTDGKQLQVAEAEPSSFHEYSASTGDTSCHVIATIPANKGFVIRSIAMDVATPSSTGFEGAAIYPNGSCSGGDIYAVGTHARAGHALSLDPGFAIAPGRKISLEALSTCLVFVHIWGYMVPPSDVASTTAVN